MIYTSRFSNPELRNGKYTAVRISLGQPRWKLGYEIAGAIEELMPRGIFGIEDKAVFSRKYFERLDMFGVKRIRERIARFETTGKPVVLLCFEDIRKGDWNWCHRRIFAEWWQQKTGEVIAELKDDSRFKAEPPKTKKKAGDKQLSLFPESEESAAEPVLIKPVFTLSKGENGWCGKEMFYRSNGEAGRKTRIGEDMAKAMISQGKAKLVENEDAKVRIRFILRGEQTSKAYWQMRNGSKREIGLENALKLIMCGKASIQDVEAE